jgi:hypothetical protein
MGGTSRTAMVLRRVTLHGMTAEVVGPRILRRTASMMLRGFPEAHPDAPADFQVSAFRVAGQRKAWSVATDNRERPAGIGVASAAIWVEWFITAEMTMRWTKFVHIHAGLVSTPHQSGLLIGPSGSGKSTTTTALALEGYRLYTDDVALVDRATMRPFCVPRPVKLDTKSRALLRPRGLVIPPGTWIGESIDRTVIPGLPPVEEPGPPLTTAIFFAPERQARPSIRPLIGAEGVMRLVMQSSSERFIGGSPTEGAMALINSVRCYELVAGDLDSTVRMVRNLLEDGEYATAHSN